MIDTHTGSLSYRFLNLLRASFTGTDYYVFDRATQQQTLLGQSPIARYAASLASVQPITMPSRDGLTLHGYLTRPQGATDKPLPMVVLVHGGPWEWDYWGYNRLVQFLANRGYVVLQINFRGSTGYGRAFSEAAVGEFAGKMHTDLLDGIWTCLSSIGWDRDNADMPRLPGDFLHIAGALTCCRKPE